MPALVSVKPPDGKARSDAIVNSERSDIDVGPGIIGGGAGGGAGGGGGGEEQAARINVTSENAAVARDRLLIMIVFLAAGVHLLRVSHPKHS